MVSLLGTISLVLADCRCVFRLGLSDSKRKFEGRLITNSKSHVRTGTVLCVCFSDQKQVCHFDFLIDEQSSRFQFRPLLGVSLSSDYIDKQLAFFIKKMRLASACRPSAKHFPTQSLLRIAMELIRHVNHAPYPFAIVRLYCIINNHCGLSIIY